MYKPNPLLSTNEIKALLKKSKIDINKQYESSNPCITQVIENNESILGSFGNFSLVTGQPKSKKSSLISSIISLCLSDDPKSNFLRSNLPKDKSKIILFDTEQGKGHVKKTLQRINNSIKNMNNLETYALRSRSLDERLEMINHTIYDTDNLGLVIIDGIKDLVLSINDEREASVIASKLLSWSEEKDIHIMVVLHENKGNNNARGHLGTELQNKAETVISVAATNSPIESNIKPVYCRNKEFLPFVIKLNNDNVPTLELKEHSFSTTKPNFNKKQLKIIAFHSFLKMNKFKYSEMWKQLKNSILSIHEQKYGDSKCKYLLSDLTKENIIINSNSTYSLNEELMNEFNEYKSKFEF